MNENDERMTTLTSCLSPTPLLVPSSHPPISLGSAEGRPLRGDNRGDGVRMGYEVRKDMDFINNFLSSYFFPLLFIIKSISWPLR